MFRRHLSERQIKQGLSICLRGVSPLLAMFGVFKTVFNVIDQLHGENAKQIIWVMLGLSFGAFQPGVFTIKDHTTRLCGLFSGFSKRHVKD